MSEFSNQLKARADIGKLIGEYVALRPGGNGFIGLCPFHSEKTPSFHVHAVRQFYYCFGCHAHGDIFEFLVQLKKMSFPEAVEAVAERMGVEVPRFEGDRDDAGRRALLDVHAAATEFFQKTLQGPQGVRARAYATERQLSAEAIAGFSLGYAPEDGRSLVRHLQAAGFTPELALRSGLCQPRREHGAETSLRAPGWNDLYDRFRDRLMFPIADERSRVLAFGGRRMAAGDDRTPKYLNSPETALYTKGRVLYNLNRARGAIRELGYVILVEGYFDCIRVFDAGFENVVASCGTALTSSQIAPLARMTKKVVLNFDPDSAGTAAAERSIGLLLEEDFRVRVVILEDQLDPDLFVLRRGRDAYAAALKSSRSFFDYLAARARQSFDLRRGEGRVAALNHLLPFLSRVHDPILRQNLAENCAASLGLDAPLLSQQLQRAARERRSHVEPAASPQAELLPAERTLVRAWIEAEEDRERLTTIVGGEHLLEGLALESAFARMVEQAAGGASWSEIMSALGPEERHEVAETMVDDAPITENLVDDAIAVLRERRGAAEIRRLQGEIRKAAGRGDREQMEALLRQKAEWDRRHSGIGTR